MLFNPEWQITSKSFLLSSFLIGFSFSPTTEISRLEIEFEESLPRKTASKRGLDRSQMEQPIKKNKFFYFARSLLQLRPQEIWERDYSKCMALKAMQVKITPYLDCLPSFLNYPWAEVMNAIRGAGSKRSTGRSTILCSCAVPLSLRHVTQLEMHLATAVDPLMTQNWGHH